MKATRNPRAARPNKAPITPPAMEPEEELVAPELSIAPAVTVEPGLSTPVGEISLKELRPPLAVVVGRVLTRAGVVCGYNVRYRDVRVRRLIYSSSCR